jgi:RNA binding exosome subunit
MFLQRTEKTASKKHYGCSITIISKRLEAGIANRVTLKQLGTLMQKF